MKTITTTYYSPLGTIVIESDGKAITSLRFCDEKADADSTIQGGGREEVEALVKLGLASSLTSRHAIGYEQVIDYLEGNSTLSDAIERTKVATRQYAKRQRTWFRKDSRIHWIDSSAYDTQDTSQLAEHAWDILKQEGVQ